MTIISLAAAEVPRPLRLLLIPLGAALLITPFAYGVSISQIAASVVCGIALIALSLRNGTIRGRYADWQKIIV